MKDYQDDFSPLLVEQQIELPDELLSAEGAHVVHEVKEMFAEEQRAVLERGWTRLMSERARVHQQKEVVDLAVFRQQNKGNIPMENGTLFSQPDKDPGKKVWQRRLGIWVAALICLVLVGSMGIMLSSRLTTGVGSGGSHATPTVVQPTPTCTNYLGSSAEATATVAANPTKACSKPLTPTVPPSSPTTVPTATATPTIAPTATVPPSSPTTVPTATATPTIAPTATATPTVAP